MVVAGEVLEIRFAQKALGIAPIGLLLPGMMNSSVFIRMSRACRDVAANKPSKLTDCSLFFFLKIPGVVLVTGSCAAHGVV